MRDNENMLIIDISAESPVLWLFSLERKETWANKSRAKEHFISVLQ